jgi:hypothetical protein
MVEERLPASLPPGGQMLIYRDGAAKLQVRLDGQTVWLTQAAMAELFQTTKQNISLHLQNILDEEELQPEAVVKEYLTTAADGKRYRTLHYSLDMILAVGYRVRSARGTAFRQWATARLSELLVKGFTLDDERIKAGRTLGAEYFDELLARIRDIRSSERLFYHAGQHFPRTGRRVRPCPIRSARARTSSAGSRTANERFRSRRQEADRRTTGSRQEIVPSPIGRGAKGEGNRR